MSLSQYKRNKKAIEKGVTVELSNGVSVTIKEYGTPEFWAYYMSQLDSKGITSENLSDIDEKIDQETTTRALVECLVLEVSDTDGESITDKDRLYEIFSDPCYWELKRDVLLQCKNPDNFRDHEKEKKVKKG